MHLLTHGPVFAFFSSLQKSTVFNQKASIFVLAFPQANLDVPVFKLPAGVNPVNVFDDNRRCYVLKLNKSLYGLKQAATIGLRSFDKD
jgi:hypothetical protein